MAGLPPSTAVQLHGDPKLQRRVPRALRRENDGRLLRGKSSSSGVLFVRLFTLPLQTFSKHVGKEGPERGWDIQNGDVPFEKLYLLELRYITHQIFQPVLAYDAD